MAATARFVHRLRDSLTAARAETLIVDVRHNNGGNNLLLAPLITALAEFRQGGPRRRIYVLTSRTTFSAAQNFINRLERPARAIFAGEPSMSSPNFTGEDHEVTLPYSGLQLSVSNRYWQDSDPADRRRWIAPALAVSLSSRAYFANQDPALEAVLAAASQPRM